jgi:hypothetical protein
MSKRSGQRPRRRFKHGIFTTEGGFAEQMLAYISTYNQTAGLDELPS